MNTSRNLSEEPKVGLSHQLITIGVILLLLGSFMIGLLSSCGTSRIGVRVKSNSDGTFNSTVTVSGSSTGGQTSPNVNVTLPDSISVVR